MGTEERGESEPGDRLDEETALLCEIVAALGTNRLERAEAALARAAARGVGRDLLAETLLLAHLYAGIPRTLWAFDRLSRLFPGPGDPPGGASLPEPDPSDARRTGEVVFGRIYGGQAAKVRGILRGHFPELERVVLEHAYGRILSRPRPGLGVRELIAVAALAAQGLPTLFESHVRGARRVGETAARIAAAAEIGLDMAPAASREALARALGRGLGQNDSEGPGDRTDSPTS